MNRDDAREHLSAETLSALADARLTQPERREAELHLAECQNCTTAFDEIRTVAALLRRLPDLDPPRDFTLGPRVAGARTAYVSRLRRWYGLTRGLASTAAAAFIVLMGADLYLEGSRGGPVPSAGLAVPAAPTPTTPATAAAKPATAPRATSVAPAPAAAPQRSAEGAQPAGALQSPLAPQADSSVSSAPTPASPPTREELAQRAAATPGRALPPLESQTPSRGADSPLSPLRAVAGSTALVGALSALLALRFRGRLKRAGDDEARRATGH